MKVFINKGRNTFMRGAIIKVIKGARGRDKKVKIGLLGRKGGRVNERLGKVGFLKEHEIGSLGNGLLEMGRKGTNVRRRDGNRVSIAKKGEKGEETERMR